VQTTIVRASSPESPVAREVRNILRLQREAEERQRTLACSRDELGNNLNNTLYNTRPFILYLPNGDEFSIRINDFFGSNNSSPASSLPINSVLNSNNNSQQRAFIFRVEEIHGNRAVLRALKYVLGKYIATCYCVTCDLDDFVAIQTLNDTYIANLVCTN
jgi:Spore coat protein Z